MQWTLHKLLGCFLFYYCNGVCSPGPSLCLHINGIFLIEAKVLLVAQILFAVITTIQFDPGVGCSKYSQLYSSQDFKQRYLAFSQISTVGYGDITPKTQLGQLVAIATILLALTIIPIQIGRITYLASRRYSKIFSSICHIWHDSALNVIC